MITRWYKRVLACALMSLVAGARNVEVTNVAGTARYIGAGLSATGLDSPTTTVSLSSGATSYGIRIGSGTTAPTATDYNLETQITSGITASTVSRAVEYDSSGNPTAVLTYALTNTSDAPITVSEVGSVQSVKMGASAGATSDAAGGVLFDRTLLDSPITIPAGETATLTYRLKSILPE